MSPASRSAGIGGSAGSARVVAPALATAASASATATAATATAPPPAAAATARETPPPAPSAGPPFSCPALQLWETRRQAWRAGTLRMRPEAQPVDASQQQQQQQQRQQHGARAPVSPLYRGGAARRGRVALSPEAVLSTAPFGAPVPLSDVVEALLEAWEEESY